MSNSLGGFELSTAVHMLDLTAISEARFLRNASIPTTSGYLEQFCIQTIRQALHMPFTLVTDCFPITKISQTRVLSAVCVISSHMSY